MTTRILVGDVRERLADIPDQSVHCCVTSPPYFGLRSYGTNPQVWGGDPDCAHEWVTERRYVEGGGNQRSAEAFHAPGEANAERLKQTRWKQDDTCALCGAWRGELGQEPTLADFIAHMVEVFREVRRVLREDGTLWLNIGDSYAPVNRGENARPRAETLSGMQTSNPHSDLRTSKQRIIAIKRAGIKQKDLMLVPERLALALQEDGWWVRSRIIWAKKSCMPESVTDRPTSAHEHIWLLTKAPRYFFDAEAVREENESSEQLEHNQRYAKVYDAYDETAHNRQPGNTNHLGIHARGGKPGRNQRNVWHLGPEPFPDAHFAVYPSEIPRRAIKAGTSEHGCCEACGVPWVRETAKTVEFTSGSGKAGNQPVGKNAGLPQTESGTYDIRMGPTVQTLTTGWAPSCSCGAGVSPCTVLDPFLGSGTTLMVADQLGRHGIGIELNPEYAAMAERRITGDAPMFADVEVA